MIEIVPNWHPIWVHFPVALLTIATVFFLAGLVLPDRAGERVTAAARWNLAAGALLLIPTLVTGYLAYNSVAHDAAGHQAMERHMTAAWVVAVLFAVAVLLAWLDRFRARGAGVVLTIVLLIGTGAVGVTGYLGAENVYRHGLGVERLPEGVSNQAAPRGAEQQPEQTGGGVSGAAPEQERASQDTSEDEGQKASDVPEGHEGHDHEH
ncbi:putative membrane protein [Halospina denitrificans]|uniref:Putative membrane protein n=1 Tax=Halospina denitrificans TaxID=332522 RepID=A0A4R7JL97_9GAMM|nr:DUF2231 domain-containing protein [Halospina denitrificans]TDT37803.1 putative membrane protein [Halospina denitrificans]